MRIAFITTDNREHLKDYGCKVPYFGTAPEALLEGFSLIPDVEIHVISCVRKAMQSPEKLAPNIWYHPLLVPKIGWLSTAYQGCIRAVRRKVRELRPDIVHGQGTERECAVSAVFSGFSNVITIHGNMRIIAKVNKASFGSYYWLNSHLESFTLPRAAGVVCISRYTEEAVRNDAKLTWVVPNAIDTRFFDIVSVPGDIPEILVVGAICQRKNQNAFIRSIDCLAGKRKFKVLFLGTAERGTEYATEFFELIKSRAWCEWKGFVDRDALCARLKSASMLVLPSIEDNCPMVVLEGMAAGVPVIAPAVGGVPELVTDGYNGLLCDPTSSKNMGDVISRALNQPDEIRKFAQTAKDDAMKRFHPRRIALDHLAIYREVLKTSS